MFLGYDENRKQKEKEKEMIEWGEITHFPSNEFVCTCVKFTVGPKFVSSCILSFVSIVSK